MENSPEDFHPLQVVDAMAGAVIGFAVSILVLRTVTARAARRDAALVSVA